MIKITNEITLVVVTCYNCGTSFAMEENLNRHARDDGNTFYCPNGHAQCYTSTREAELKKAQEQLERRKEEIAWYSEHYELLNHDLQNTRRMLSSTKGQLTRTKKRLANGVCPCCHRQFENLHRHMRAQHPEYDKSDADGKN